LTDNQIVFESTSATTKIHFYQKYLEGVSKNKISFQSLLIVDCISINNE